MTYSIKETNEDWGKVWYFKNKYSRFALYTYDDEPGTIYLANVYVYKRYRDNGYGNEILKYAEQFAVENNFSIIILKVIDNSFAYNWYIKHGYQFLENDDTETLTSYVWLIKYL